MLTRSSKSNKVYDMDKMSDFVDRLVKDDYFDTDVNLFWKEVFDDVTMQQMFVKCLIYKNISFAYKLGHKPLRDAMRVIKNSNKLGSEGMWTKSDQSGVSLPDVSPQKKSRISSSQNRRKSNDPKNNQGLNRNPAAPTSNGPPPHSKIKRKSSDNLNDDQVSSSGGHGSGGLDYFSATGVRFLLYTVSYVINLCDISKWDFNSLREVFLIWNKARNWEHANASCSFENSLMKRISRPPDVVSEEAKWEQMITDLLNCYHYHVEASDLPLKYLSHQHVGNSIKYIALRNRLQQNQSSTSSLLEAIISTIIKMHARHEEAKILSLLHLFCETVVMASHVPAMVLQKAYAAIQRLFLLPLPVSATVKEVLDLIQIEMKSPGYFRRTIYFQEKESHSVQSTPPSIASAGATNVFIDKGNNNWANMESALDVLSRRSSFMREQGGEALHQQMAVEQIFHSVFGESGCDLPTLRHALQTCAESRLSSIYSEALSVMEQSLSMENPQHAQEFIKQQLEGLSTDLLEDDLKGEDAVNSETSLFVIKEKSTSPDPTTKPQHSAPSVTSVIAPRRNKSYLSRAVSTESCTIEKRADVAMETGGDLPHVPIINKMNYSQVIMKSFDKDQLSDAIFDLVRSTAKDFVAEKRRSGGVYSTARKRYMEKKRSTQLASDERDSGLMEERDIGSIDERDSGSLEGSPSFNTTKERIISPLTASASSEDFWRKFSEDGFKQKMNPSDDPMDDLISSFQYSDLFSDENFKESSKSTEFLSSKPDLSEIRRCKSSGPELTSLSAKPPVEAKNLSDGISTDRSKSANAKPKKSKSRLKTWGRFKGMKVIKGIRKNASMRGFDIDISPEMQQQQLSDMTEASSGETSQPQSVPISPSTKFGSVGSLPPPTTSFFDIKMPPRWRTTSLPIKTSLRGKKKEKGKRGNVKELFASTHDVRSDIPSSNDSEVAVRRHSMTTTTDDTSPKLESENGSEEEEEKEEVKGDEEKPKSDENVSRVPDEPGKPQQTSPDSESRHRMDSGIMADRSSDDGSLVSPGHSRSIGEWEETGVAGVKFTRKHVLRKNRRSRSSLSHQVQEKISKKKVLKLAFVGNDKTVGDAARAYYELRRRQTTRAPLLHQIDLRLYYIPVGQHIFSDESGATPSVTAPFDLEIAGMLGTFDPWYRSIVCHATNNLLRIRPTTWRDDEEDQSDQASDACFGSHPTADMALANGIMNYFRFAIKTTYVPIYKATMRTSTEEIITEVFCCRAEIGNVAYQQAIAAGRFGKMGKLVDLSDDNGPPAAYTSFKYRKYGINGGYLSSKTLDDAYFFTATFVPISLSGSNRDQARFPGADGLSVTLQDNEKRMKLLKRGTKVSAQELDATFIRFTASEAKMEVVRPVQGTFTVSLDHTLIHTNIKSFEVSRCLAPEFERPNAKKRRVLSSSHVMSLPLKTFWPNTNLA